MCTDRNSVIITSVLRITTLDISSKATDPISGTLISTTWTSVETHASIIVACLPAFKAPIGRIWNRLVPCSRSGQSTRTVNHMEVIGRRSSRPDPLLEFAGLGNIAVMTDVEVEYEHKSRGSSSVNFNQQRLSMDA